MYHKISFKLIAIHYPYVATNLNKLVLMNDVKNILTIFLFNWMCNIIVSLYTVDINE